MNTLQLRPYQHEALSAIAEFHERGVSRQLVVLPTAAGKTIIFSHIPQFISSSLPMLVLAHRAELLTQAKDKILWSNPDLDVQIEQAANVAGHADVVVASVPTLGMKDSTRIEKFPKDYFHTIVIDESHHAAAPSYRRILDYFTPNLLVGVTATPQRSDNVRLTDIFDEIVYYKTIEDLIEQGYLCPLTGFRIKSDTDISGVASSDGDYVASQLEDAIDNPARNALIVATYHRLVPGSKAIVFCAGVQHAHNVAASFSAAQIPTAVIIGETSPDERQDILNKYKTGQIRVLINVGVLCLDDQTEILTDKGWVGYQHMTYQHRVANWDNGNVYFVEPDEIVVRDLGINEFMYSLKTRTRDVRVTGGHRMLYRTHPDQPWSKTAVENLVGRMIDLPVAGHADPFPVTFDQPSPKTPSQLKRLVSASSYNLRKLENYSYDESFVEADRRIRRRYNMIFTQPQDLSLDDCRLIGFWIGDASVNDRLIRGGKEYTFSQANVYSGNIQWFDNLLHRLQLSFVRKHVTSPTPHVRWSLSRGTGSGSQEREGLFRLEPYLCKDGTDLFWGLNHNQFDALIEGLWRADGNHGLATADSQLPQQSLRIDSTNKNLLDLLQAIAVVRGWSASVRPGRLPVKAHHAQIYRLSMHRRLVHHIGSGLHHQFQKELEWKPETVWCVKTQTKNIITRRNGFVTVMGNTEGFDEPSIQTIILARPTRSTLLFTQIIGRGLRLHESKTQCTIIDIADMTKGKKPVGLPSLLGLPPEFDLEGQDLLEIYNKYKELEEYCPGEAVRVLSPEDIDIAYTRINLFMPPPPNEFVQEYSRFVWAEIGDNVYHLGIDNANSLRITVDALGRWVVEHHNRTNGITILGYPEDMRDAFVRSDRWVTNRFDTNLIDSTSSWRADPPTPAQTKLLKRIGVPITSDLTKGTASQIISKWKESQPPRPDWLERRIQQNKRW